MTKIRAHAHIHCHPDIAPFGFDTSYQQQHHHHHHHAHKTTNATRIDQTVGCCEVGIVALPTAIQVSKIVPIERAMCFFGERCVPFVCDAKFFSVGRIWCVNLIVFVFRFWQRGRALRTSQRPQCHKQNDSRKYLGGYGGKRRVDFQWPRRAEGRRNSSPEGRRQINRPREDRSSHPSTSRRHINRPEGRCPRPREDRASHPSTSRHINRHIILKAVTESLNRPEGSGSRY